jgi:hypothetical protein
MLNPALRGGPPYKIKIDGSSSYAGQRSLPAIASRSGEAGGPLDARCNSETASN